MNPAARAACLLAVLCAASCGPTGPPPAIDPAISSCIPADAQLLAGIQLQHLRESGVYSNLPPSVKGMLDPLQNASDVLIAMNASDLLLIAKGQFTEPVAGATLVDRTLILSGSPSAIQTAIAQHKKRRPVAKEMLARADPLARASQLWMVAQGRAALPLPGNGQNVNRLLSLTEYSTLSAKLGPTIEIEADGICRSPDDARRLEETLRAFVSLAILGASRKPEIAGVLRSIQVTRENSAARMTLSAPSGAINEILPYLAQ